MGKKEINKAKILEYLGNPENEFLNRAGIALVILGYKQEQSMYQLLKPSDLNELEAEAFEMRKKRSAMQQSQVYAALYKKAIKGDVAACKEWLDRTAGKVTDKIKHSGGVEFSGTNLIPVKPKKSEGED